MIIDFQGISPKERYHITTSVVVPRPIAWVVTEGVVNDKTITNIAPFSYFTPLSSEPAALLVSIGHRPDGSPKDTLRNLRESKKCTICIIDENHFEPMHLSGTPLVPDESEAEKYDIIMEDTIDGYPPMPAGIKAAMFGTYMQEIDLGGKTVPVIIEIDHLYLDDNIITDKEKLKIDFDAIARMGNSYRVLGVELEAPRS